VRVTQAPPGKKAPGTAGDPSHRPGDASGRADVKGSLRRPPAAPDPDPPSRTTHRNLRSPLFRAQLTLSWVGESPLG
jgi:hypothetical protein